MEFFDKYKKIIFIFLFFAIIIIFGYFLYALFFKPSLTPGLTPPTSTETGVEGTIGGLPIAQPGTGQIVTPGKEGLPGETTKPTTPDAIAQGGLTITSRLTNTPVISPSIGANGRDLQYYNKQEGKFYRIDSDGKTTALSDKVFYSAENVVWSPVKNKAIIEYPDGSNIVYDFDTDKQTTLPKHWEGFDFSPEGDKMVMKSIGASQESNWLAIANEDGSGARTIEFIGKNADKIMTSWSPNNQMIAMYTEGVDFDRQDVFFVGLNGENFKSTTVEGRGFMPEWSPKGDRLLYSVYSSKNNLKPMLWVVAAEGENIGNGRKSLGVETWANKCIFANNVELYCGVPNDLPEGSGWLPDLAAKTNDTLYKINTITGVKKMIAVPDGEYNITEPIVSEDQRYLYFTDKTTGFLHKINLK